MKTFFLISSQKKLYFAETYSATTFFAQIFFPDGTQPSWKITEIPGGGGCGYDKPPWNFHSRGVGGLKQKRPPSGRGGGGYGYFLELHDEKLQSAISRLNGNTCFKFFETSNAFWVKLVEQLTMPACKCPNVTETTELKKIYNWACPEAAQ